MSANGGSPAPSELRLASRWEEVSYLALSHTGAGLCLGALASVVVLGRRPLPAARGESRPLLLSLTRAAAMNFFGAGFGSGIAFARANALVEHEIACAERSLAETARN